MKNYISCFCVAIVCMMQMLCFVSCKSDGDDGGQPVITGVRTIDPKRPTACSPKQTHRI